jgi:hypothetical protein
MPQIRSNMWINNLTVNIIYSGIMDDTQDVLEVRHNGIMLGKK